MKISKLSKTSRIWVIILILVFIFFMLPIKIPYSIKAPGKILPSKEWLIIKDRDGKILTMLKDNESGISKNYTITQFIRGDAVQFALADDISTGGFINKADTIATVFSNETEMRYAKLMGDLAIAKASLAVQASGDKQTLVKEAKEKLEYLKKKAEDQRSLFKRTEELFHKDLIAAEEFEIAKGNLSLCDLDIGIAEAHLKSMESGEKNEMIDYIGFKIKSLESQLVTLQAKFQGYKVVSQISGVVCKMQEGDTLLVIDDNSKYSVVLPITWEQSRFVKSNQIVYLKVPGTGNIKNAALSFNEKSVRLINRQQVLFHIASLNSGGDDIIPGLMVECSIQCDPVSPLTYLKRMFKFYN